MKPSDVLRNAAELLAGNDFRLGACMAIFGCSDSISKQSMAIEYFKLFRPPLAQSIYWWPRKKNDERILALLFAAAIAESEGM